MSLQVTQLVGFGAGGGRAGPVSIAYQGDVSATGSGTPNVTFTAVPFGAEAGDRRIYVCITWEEASLGFPSVTIAGVSATAHAGLSGNSGAVIFSAPVSSGANGNVVVTFSANASSTMRLSSYRVVNIEVPEFAFDEDSNSSAVALTLTQAVPINGGLIAVHIRVTDTQTLTWTGATENVDVDAGTYRHSAASAEVPAGDPARAVTGTGSASGGCTQALVVIG